MNGRFVRATLAIVSILTASIVLGGTMVFTGGILYRWLMDAMPSGLALTVLGVAALAVVTLVIWLGQIAMRDAFRRATVSERTGQDPDQLIIMEALKVLNANPGKLVLASLGVGFALGLSPRLRRTVYRSFVD